MWEIKQKKTEDHLVYSVSLKMQLQGRTSLLKTAAHNLKEEVGAREPSFERVMSPWGVPESGGAKRARYAVVDEGCPARILGHEETPTESKDLSQGGKGD